MRPMKQPAAINDVVIKHKVVGLNNAVARVLKHGAKPGWVHLIVSDSSDDEATLAESNVITLDPNGIKALKLLLESPDE